MKYSIVTFGCRVNQADSLAIEAELCCAGGESVSADQADLVIVNTCSVTASADQGARQTIRRIARENPAARIVATGCYATRCHDEVAALPGVAAVVPNGDKTPATFFRNVSSTLAPWHSGTLALADGPCGQPIAPGLMGRTAWTLRVQTGCEESCSYCIIPTTRGASRSRSLIEIRSELERVLVAGYKEIAITGVHLGSYGRDLEPRSSLSELLESLSALASAAFDTAQAKKAEPHNGAVLFRISSLEPMDCTPELVDLVGAATVAGPGFSPAAMFAPHFHLPLQHASNRLLKAMQRPYSIEYYSALVDSIRKKLAHAAIGSDLIVGFPGETEEDFDELTSYLLRSPLTSLHVFPYSDRPGTVASGLPDKVHGSVIKRRAQRLREISRLLADRFRASQMGTTRPALTIDEGSVAVTDNYFRVPAPPGHSRNEWVSVTL
jgi:threonylcarbamoyladenosine tRNA methylthiotransferase MtaB